LRSGVILAGGRSSRMGGDKGLAELGGKPIIAHVVERLRPVVDEVIIVVGSEAQQAAYQSLGARVVADFLPPSTPLVGAYTGLREARGGYALLTGGDQPLLDPRVVELLFTKAEGHDAATPSWPNGWVEPLHSVYQARAAAEAALCLIESGERKLGMILGTLPDIVRVPIGEVKAIDPELRTLMDVDTAEDLKRIRGLLERGQ
jgi:molybdopterin-guanine dinucleotide biosynthesis protein A